MKPLLLLALLSIPLIGAEYYHQGKLKTLTPEPSPRVQTNSMSSASSAGTRWYRTEEGRRVGVNSAILVQWKDASKAEEILKEFALTDAEKISETIWLVQVPSSRDLFAVTKDLYEHEAVEFAQPDMIKERRMR